MDLVAVLKDIDHQLFLLINNYFNSHAVDQFFLFFSFYPLIIWLGLGILLIWIEEKRDKTFLPRLIIALILAGVVVSVICKPLFKRPRPDLTYIKEIHLVDEQPALVSFNNDFSFPSGHAAVAFAGLYIVIKEPNRFYRKKKQLLKRKIISNWIFVLIALLTALSRIYLGKHYPLDVIIGGIVGWMVAWVVCKGFNYFSFAKDTKF